MPSSGADLVGSVRDQARTALDRLHLLASRRALIVAVSGGADSLCLLDALVGVLPNAGRRLVVGHVDHRLRPESALDAEHVGAVAARYGLRCAVVAADVPALAARLRLGIEEAARIARYRALGRLAAEHGAVAVATGHTRDDHVETVLLHLLRGSGRSGLAGLAPRERLSLEPRPSEADVAAPPEVVVARPILSATRADTAAYCAARGIRWRVDPTNADPRYLRNRVRHHLLPVLRTYNVGIDDAIDRLARTVHDEEAWLEQIVERRWRRLGRDEDGSPAVAVGDWRRQPLAVRRRLVRHVAARLGRHDLSFEAVERAVAVGTPDGPSRTELGGGLVARRVRGILRFEVDVGLLGSEIESGRVRDDRGPEGAPA